MRILPIRTDSPSPRRKPAWLSDIPETALFTIRAAGKPVMLPRWNARLEYAFRAAYAPTAYTGAARSTTLFTPRGYELANLALTLKNEIARIARRELRKETE